MNTTGTLEGDEWQDYVLTLLSLHYGSNLIAVPDDDGGDGGIEAFSLDGCAFQCYGPEGPLKTADIAKAHKQKIYDDIRKFCENRKLLKSRFGATKIRRWILLVPEHCSADVVAYCQKKTSEILSLAEPLPYIDPNDFQVLAADGYLFLAKEANEFSRTGGFLIEAEVSEVVPLQVTLFVADHNEWIENLENKLSRLPDTDQSERARLRDEFLRWHLEANNAISYYDAKYAVVADKIRVLKAMRAKALETESKLQRLSISGTRQTFEQELLNSVPSLGKNTALTLSFGSITEWLMVCPLNPKG